MQCKSQPTALWFVHVQQRCTDVGPRDTGQAPSDEHRSASKHQRRLVLPRKKQNALLSPHTDENYSVVPQDKHQQYTRQKKPTIRCALTVQRIGGMATSTQMLIKSGMSAFLRLYSHWPIAPPPTTPTPPPSPQNMVTFVQAHTVLIPRWR
jgi:hypothetical protein